MLRLHCVVWSLLLAVAACPSPREPPAARRTAPQQPVSRGAPWPALPWAEDRAEALIRARTRRPVVSLPRGLKRSAQLVERIRERARQGKLVAGWGAITAWLQAHLDQAGQREAFLLWGSYHDSGGQLAAFRRLVGPQGLQRLSAVSVEQFTADGRWQGVEPDQQRGDSSDLARYLKRGQRSSLQALRRGQLDHDYTAWKYRYLHEVLDLASTARAVGQRLLGCDMPRKLQRRLYRASKAPTHLPALRELHCLLHLQGALAGASAPRRVAMLWGQSHIAPGGLPRFLPPGTRVIAIHLVGQRPGPHGMAFQLGRAGLRIVDPLLVPVSHTEGLIQAALILPDRSTLAQLHRARDVGAAGSGVTVQSSAAGRLSVGGGVYALSADSPTTLPLSPGSHAFVLEGRGLLLAGSLEVSRGARVQLSLQPEVRPPVVQLTVSRPEH